jgi:undecaprenyl pyrophosphate phosphatase UppP
MNNGSVKFDKVDVLSVHTNTTQTLINITEDRLRLKLIDYEEVNSARRRYEFPLGVLIALVPTLLTASEFRNVFGLKADTWQALFVIATILSGVAVLWTLWRGRDSCSIDDLVKRIKTPPEQS